MKTSTEDEINEPDEYSNESAENIQHIKQIERKRNEQTLHCGNTKSMGYRRIFNTHRVTNIDDSIVIKILKSIEREENNGQIQDVNKNEVKLRVNVTINIENKKKYMEILRTERAGITPLMGMDCMKTLNSRSEPFNWPSTTNKIKRKYSKSF